MNRLIEDEVEYDNTLKRVHTLMLTPEMGPTHPLWKEYQYLAALAQIYGDEHHPIPKPSDPLQAISFWIDQRGLSDSEVSKLFGARSTQIGDSIGQAQAIPGYDSPPA